MPSEEVEDRSFACLRCGEPVWVAVVNATRPTILRGIPCLGCDATYTVTVGQAEDEGDEREADDEEP